jgi:hypothetical protein
MNLPIVLTSQVATKYHNVGKLKQKVIANFLLAMLFALFFSDQSSINIYL